jgi:hypothetical protein
VAKAMPFALQNVQLYVGSRNIYTQNQPIIYTFNPTNITKTINENTFIFTDSSTNAEDWFWVIENIKTKK